MSGGMLPDEGERKGTYKLVFVLSEQHHDHVIQVVTRSGYG